MTMTGNTEFFNVSGKPKIKLRTPQFIYARSLLLYTFFYTIAFAFGCLLFHFLETKESATIDARILSYFSADFADCDDIFEYTGRLLTLSKQDLSNIFIIFTAGFTMLAGVIVSALLLFRGFSMGFSISYLAYTIRCSSISLERPIASVILFSVLCAIGAALMIHMSVKTTIFADDFKALGGRPRKIIRSKALYMQIFRFLIAFGAILILNLIRCVL